MWTCTITGDDIHYTDLKVIEETLVKLYDAGVLTFKLERKGSDDVNETTASWVLDD